MSKHCAIPPILISTTLTACTDSIVGEWEGKQITVDNETYILPYEFCYSDSVYDEYGEVIETGEEICKSVTYSIIVQDDFSADFVFYAGTYSATVTKEDSKNYQIEAEELSLNCVLEKQELTCSSEGTEIIFDKK